jgi:hypothetical protein
MMIEPVVPVVVDPPGRDRNGENILASTGARPDLDAQLDQYRGRQADR